MQYDAIMHQVVTHKMLISVRQDRDGGIAGKESAEADLAWIAERISQRPNAVASAVAGYCGQRAMDSSCAGNSGDDEPVLYEENAGHQHRLFVLMYK